MLLISTLFSYSTMMIPALAFNLAGVLTTLTVSVSLGQNKGGFLLHWLAISQN